MKIAVCAIVRNEATLITEWLAHHLTLGFDAAIVIDHASVDGTREQLDRIAALADIRASSLAASGEHRQRETYEAVCREHRYEFDWIAFLDADEFLMPIDDRPISSLLEAGRRASGIAVPWRIYGSGGHYDSPKLPTLSAYQRRAPDDFGPNAHTKCIVRPMEVAACLNPHYFEIRGPYVGPDGDEAMWDQPGFLAGDRAHLGWHVNHYFTRSRFHWTIRMERGQLGTIIRSWDDFMGHDRNEVLDPPPSDLMSRVSRRRQEFQMATWAYRGRDAHF